VKPLWVRLVVARRVTRGLAMLPVSKSVLVLWSRQARGSTGVECRWYESLGGFRYFHHVSKVQLAATLCKQRLCRSHWYLSGGQTWMMGGSLDPHWLRSVRLSHSRCMAQDAAGACLNRAYQSAVGLHSLSARRSGLVSARCRLPALPLLKRRHARSPPPSAAVCCCVAAPASGRRQQSA
jgi:hypothetical protein